MSAVTQAPQAPAVTPASTKTTDCIVNTIEAIKASSVVSKARLLKVPTESEPLQVVVIHGDPTKPNSILPGGKWDEDDFYTIERLREALTALKKYSFKILCNHDTLFDDLRLLKQQNRVDLVLQLCDEGFMNNSRMELHVVALLEVLEIPFTGIGPKLMGMTYDKQCILKVAESIGVPVPKSIFIEEGDSYDPKDYGMLYPVIVKPNSTDGSFGITAKNVCSSLEQLHEAVSQIRNIFHIRGPILLQEYLTGRDVNVGVMEKWDPNTKQYEPWVLPISEEDYSALPEGLPKICGFESKWDESSPYYKIQTRPTTLSPEMQEKVGQWTKRLFKRIECRDYGRFDWRLDGQGNPRLLEANPNCGWCWDGHLPKTASLCGILYPRFFEMILESAWHRAERLAQLKDEDKHHTFIQVQRNGAEQLYKPTSTQSTNGER